MVLWQSSMETCDYYHLVFSFFAKLGLSPNSFTHFFFIFFFRNSKTKQTKKHWTPDPPRPPPPPPPPPTLQQCCVTMVFPLSLQCHAVECYTVLYHHGVPSFFTVSCHLMLHRQCCVTMAFPLCSVIPLDVTQTCVASPWYSLTLYSVMLLDVTQTWITMVFPFSLPCHAIGCYTDMYCITITMVFPHSLPCHAIGCYTDMYCITMVFPHSLQCHAVGCYTYSVVSYVPSFFTVSCHWMLHSVVSDVPSFCTVSCCWMLHRHVLYHMFPLSLQCHAVGCYTDMCCIICSLFLYSVMLLDVTQTCVVSYVPSFFTVSCCWMLHRHVLYHMFPLSLQCHADGCYTLLYHHGIPSFFTVSCCWMLRRHVLYHRGIFSFFSVVVFAWPHHS